MAKNSQKGVKKVKIDSNNGSEWGSAWEGKVGWSDGGRIGGSGVGGGWLGSGGGSDPKYLQSNNKHTRYNQCKMIMGNIILCPTGPKNFK